MASLLPADAMVVRFAPNSPDGILKRANMEFRRSSHYRVSAFAAAAFDHENEDQLIDRLLKASELSGLAATSNPKYYLCSSAGQIEALGLEFIKDGYDGEVEEHFSIDFGEAPALEDAERLSGVFTTRKRN